MNRDFRVHDKVTCLIHGKGVITGVNMFGQFPMEVLINGQYRRYTFFGYWTTSANRQLYHGHNISVQGEEPPVRTVKCFVNIYKHKTVNECIGKYCYDTKEDAEDDIPRTWEHLGILEIDVPE